MTYKQRAIVSGTIALAGGVVSFAFAILAVSGGPSWSLIVAAVSLVVAVVEIHHACSSIAQHEYEQFEKRRRYEDNYDL